MLVQIMVRSDLVRSGEGQVRLDQIIVRSGRVRSGVVRSKSANVSLSQVKSGASR